MSSTDFVRDSRCETAPADAWSPGDLYPTEDLLDTSYPQNESISSLSQCSNMPNASRTEPEVEVLKALRAQITQAKNELHKLELEVQEATKLRSDISNQIAEYGSEYALFLQAYVEEIMRLSKLHRSMLELDRTQAKGQDTDSFIEDRECELNTRLHQANLQLAIAMLLVGAASVRYREAQERTREYELYRESQERANRDSLRSLKDEAASFERHAANVASNFSRLEMRRQAAIRSLRAEEGACQRRRILLMRKIGAFENLYNNACQEFFLRGKDLNRRVLAAEDSLTHREQLIKNQHAAATALERTAVERSSHADLTERNITSQLLAIKEEVGTMRDLRKELDERLRTVTSTESSLTATCVKMTSLTDTLKNMGRAIEWVSVGDRKSSARTAQTTAANQVAESQVSIISKVDGLCDAIMKQSQPCMTSIAAAQSVYSELANALGYADAPQSKSLADKLRGLLANVNSVKEEAQRRAQENKELKKTHDEVLSRLEELQTQRAEMERKTAEYKIEYDKRVAEIERSKREASELLDTIRTKRQERESLESQIKALQSQSEKLDRKCQDTNLRISEAKRTLMALEENALETTKRKEDLLKRIDELEKNLVQLENAEAEQCQQKKALELEIRQLLDRKQKLQHECQNQAGKLQR